MSFMTPRQRTCLAALTVQSLVRDGSFWRFGERGVFSASTVGALIKRGLARRLGRDRVIAIMIANDNEPLERRAWPQ
jgi:hypothetical protein